MMKNKEWRKRSILRVLQMSVASCTSGQSDSDVIPVRPLVSSSAATIRECFARPVSVRVGPSVPKDQQTTHTYSDLQPTSLQQQRATSTNDLASHKASSSQFHRSTRSISLDYILFLQRLLVSARSDNCKHIHVIVPIEPVDRSSFVRPLRTRPINTTSILWVELFRFSLFRPVIPFWIGATFFEPRS